MDAFEREEELIEREFDEGKITLKERNRQLNELRRDYQAEAERSAQDAYESEMARW